MAEKEFARDKNILIRVTSEEKALYQRAQALAGFKGDADFYRNIIKYVCVTALLYKMSYIDKELFIRIVGANISNHVIPGTARSKIALRKAGELIIDDERDAELLLGFGNLMDESVVKFYEELKAKSEETPEDFRKRLEEQKQEFEKHMLRAKELIDKIEKMEGESEKEQGSQDT